MNKSNNYRKPEYKIATIEIPAPFHKGVTYPLVYSSNEEDVYNAVNGGMSSSGIVPDTVGFVRYSNNTVDIESDGQYPQFRHVLYTDSLLTHMTDPVDKNSDVKLDTQFHPVSRTYDTNGDLYYVKKKEVYEYHPDVSWGSSDDLGCKAIVRPVSAFGLSHKMTTVFNSIATDTNKSGFYSGYLIFYNRMCSRYGINLKGQETQKTLTLNKMMINGCKINTSPSGHDIETPTTLKEKLNRETKRHSFNLDSCWFQREYPDLTRMKSILINELIGAELFNKALHTHKAIVVANGRILQGLGGCIGENLKLKAVLEHTYKLMGLESLGDLSFVLVMDMRHGHGWIDIDRNPEYIPLYDFVSWQPCSHNWGTGAEVTRGTSMLRRYLDETYPESRP